MAFDRPDAPGRDPDAPQFDPNTHLGDLLVVQVSDLMESVETEYGDRPVVVADVYVIQRDATISMAYPEAWLFGTVLYNQLKKKKGRTVLGVLEQGEKRPGKKPPWRLGDASDAQEAVALRAMASKPDAAVEPEPEPAQKAQDPWSTPEPERQPATVGAGAEKAPWE